VSGEGQCAIVSHANLVCGDVARQRILREQACAFVGAFSLQIASEPRNHGLLR
jgi:hypothetical protein